MFYGGSQIVTTVSSEQQTPLMFKIPKTGAGNFITVTVQPSRQSFCNTSKKESHETVFSFVALYNCCGSDR